MPGELPTYGTRLHCSSEAYLAQAIERLPPSGLRTGTAFLHSFGVLASCCLEQIPSVSIKLQHLRHAVLTAESCN